MEDHAHCYQPPETSSAHCVHAGDHTRFLPLHRYHCLCGGICDSLHSAVVQEWTAGRIRGSLPVSQGCSYNSNLRLQSDLAVSYCNSKILLFKLYKLSIGCFVFFFRESGNATYQISRASSSNEGIYTCNATSPSGSTARTTLLDISGLYHPTVN